MGDRGSKVIIKKKLSIKKFWNFAKYWKRNLVFELQICVGVCTHCICVCTHWQPDQKEIVGKKNNVPNWDVVPDRSSQRWKLNLKHDSLKVSQESELTMVEYECPWKFVSRMIHKLILARVNWCYLGDPEQVEGILKIDYGALWVEHCDS